MLPAVVLLASWTVQAHLGTSLVVGGVCALAVVGGWIASRGERRAWLAPALAAGLAAWLALALAVVELLTSRRRTSSDSAPSSAPAPAPRRLGLPGTILAGACLVGVVTAATVPLVRRPFLLIDVDTPELAEALAAIDARPGERIVVDGDWITSGLPVGGRGAGRG
jgi:hypothetical protein